MSEWSSILSVLPQTKALSLADEFSPPNTQYMFSSLAAMDLNFKPLLDVCSRKIAGENERDPLRCSQNYRKQLERVNQDL